MEEVGDVVMECDFCGEETILTAETLPYLGSPTVSSTVRDLTVDDEEREEILSLPSRTCVNSEERTVDFKRWKELMDTGLNIDYRCIRSRACNDCRNADQTEKVNLR